MAPLISCVVPVYNGERFIAEALDSIFNQTYRHIEVIVADDGSTDETSRIVGSYENRVRRVFQERGGPSATRNLGLRHARGELIAFLDADDLWHREKLERQAARFVARPELQVSVTQVQHFWESELEEEKKALEGHPRAQTVPGYATTSLLAHRGVFDAVGSFSSDLWLADAAEWFIRAREKAIVIELLPEPLVYHRMHSQNITRRMSDASCAEFARVLKASLDRRRACGPSRAGHA
jgi:glycosyltransferase involved in cell wall biosynthesis